MNEKEFNLQILAKVREIANEVFNHVKLNIEGTFTASELWKGKNYAGEEINIDWGNIGRVRHTAQIDTYKFEVTSDHIFYLVWKFERLCGVTQKEKSRYTFGESECESISEKTMYMNIKGQILTRKKDMVKLYDNIAYSIEGKRANPFVLYVFAGKLWYMVGDAKDKDTMREHVKLLRQKDFILANLKRRPELVDESKCMYAPIFKALYEVLCAEAIKDTPEERKCENKAENAVICDAVAGKTESDTPNVEQMEVKEIGNGLYKDADNLYFEHEERLYILGGYTRGVASFLKEQPDIKAKIVSMIEEGGISTESAKILYEKLTGHKLGEPAKVDPVHEEEHEDYPPEPYNETGKTSCNDELGNTPERKATRTAFARQKVFPNELYLRRRKIRRFKRLSFAGYTNYHPRVESAANQAEIGSKRAPGTLRIRGSTIAGFQSGERIRIT